MSALRAELARELRLALLSANSAELDRASLTLRKLSRTYMSSMQGAEDAVLEFLEALRLR